MIVNNNKELRASEHIRIPVLVGTSAWRAVFCAFPQKYETGSYISHISKTLQHECREHKTHRMRPAREGSAQSNAALSSQRAFQTNHATRKLGMS